MGCGRVTLVHRETVPRIPIVQCDHQGVSRGLREDARRRDAHGNGVTADDGCLATAELGDVVVAVHEHVLRRNTQRLHGASHREEPCAQDVEAIDFGRFGTSHCPCDRRPLQQWRETLALTWREHLRIVDAIDLEIRRQGDRRCHDRTCETARACLVDTSDDVKTGSPVASFVDLSGR